MDIKGVEKNLNDVDSLLTTLGKVLKKHWKLLLLIAVCYSIYWIWTTDLEDDASYDDVE